MLTGWEKKLDILGPIEQAERCLDFWLREENRLLTEKQRQRATALMARYFHHEDGVTDQLMLSFLRHYSNNNEIDMEDPASVRMEIKAVLDKSQMQVSALYSWKRVLTGFLVGVLMMAVNLGGWEATHRKITREQQAELKDLVHQIDVLDRNKTAAAIWNEVKTPLQIKSYQEMSWWDYRQGREMLKKRLENSNEHK